MSSSCGSSFCKRQQRITEYCPQHKNNLLSHFCANQACLEMLCIECVKDHQLAHKKMNLSEEKICTLADIQEYYEKVADKELQYEKSKKDSNGLKNKSVDPCQVLCQYVDEYFYGSNENKVENMKARKEILKNPSSKAFIDVLQKSAHYKVQQQFKEKYFNFLDSLLSQHKMH